MKETLQGLIVIIAQLSIYAAFAFIGYMIVTGNPICQIFVGATPSCNPIEYHQQLKGD